MRILIKNNQRKQRLDPASLRTRLRKLLSALGLPDAELSVLLVGDTAMRSLNNRYRAKDRTTDVLSFPMREGRFGRVRPELLGDIVISVPAAARQAQEAGHTVGNEIDRLMVHGLLHLAGHDHEKGGEKAKKMQREEVRLLSRLKR